MLSSLRILAGVLASSFLLVSFPATAVAPPGGRHLGQQVPDQLIVRFRDDARLADRDAQMLRLGAEPMARFARGHNTLLQLPRGSDVRSAIARLKASGLVEYAHPNFVHRKLALCTALVAPHFCPNDPSFTSQYHLHNSFIIGGNDGDADLDMPEAWSIHHEHCAGPQSHLYHWCGLGDGPRNRIVIRRSRCASWRRLANTAA